MGGAGVDDGGDDVRERGAGREESAAVGADDGVEDDPGRHTECGSGDDGADGDSSETQEVVGDRERGVREETHQRNFGGLHEGVAVAAHGAVHLFQLRRDRSTRGRTDARLLRQVIADLPIPSSAARARGDGGGAHGGA